MFVTVYVEDFLGSSRIVTQSNGTVCYDADFPPYGQERWYTNSCTQNAYKFEGKERDSETQNDEFGARSYSWRFGRWLSADWSSVPVPVPYANLNNPQTLNLYAMVADDPESFADLDGHQGASCNGPNNSCEEKNTKPVAGNTNVLVTQVQAQAEKAKEDAQNAATVRDRTVVTGTMRLGNGTITYTKDVYTVHDNKDGTTTATNTVTTLTFSTKEGEGGKFLSGTTQTSTTLNSIAEHGAMISGDSGKPTSLSASGAMSAIGGPTYQSMQLSAAATGTPGFLTITGRDMRKDPIKYVGVAAGVVSKVCPNPLCKAAAGAVAAGAGTYEAWKHTHGDPSR